ncbi:MAG: hypothetical protein IJZ26_02435 [Clostridia bacterium]|nr:hypothetical protein [Clostridia bacterium]
MEYKILNLKQKIINADVLENTLGFFPDFKNWIVNSVKFENSIFCVYLQTKLEQPIENKNTVRVEIALHNAQILGLELECNNLVPKINEISGVEIVGNNFKVITQFDGVVVDANFEQIEFTHIGIFNEDPRTPLLIDFLKLISKRKQ